MLCLRHLDLCCKMFVLQNLACKDEVCLEVGCDTQTAASLMSKMTSSANALGMSPSDIPCPQPGGPEPTPSVGNKPDGGDPPKDPATKKPAKKPKEKAPATQLHRMCSILI